MMAPLIDPTYSKMHFLSNINSNDPSISIIHSNNEMSLPLGPDHQHNGTKIYAAV